MAERTLSRLDPVGLLRRASDLLSSGSAGPGQARTAALLADIGVFLADTSGQARRLDGAGERDGAARGWAAMEYAQALCRQSAVMYSAHGEDRQASAALECAELIAGRVRSMFGSPSPTGGDVAALLDQAAKLRAAATVRVEWRIADPVSDRYCVAFSRDSCADPEREAHQWLAEHRRAYPNGRFVGYEVVRTDVVQPLDRAAIEAASLLEQIAVEIAEREVVFAPPAGEIRLDANGVLLLMQSAAIAEEAGTVLKRISASHGAGAGAAGAPHSDVLLESARRLRDKVKMPARGAHLGDRDAKDIAAAAAAMEQAGEVLERIRGGVMGHLAWDEFGMRDFLPDELGGAAGLLRDLVGMPAHEAHQERSFGQRGG